MVLSSLTIMCVMDTKTVQKEKMKRIAQTYVNQLKVHTLHYQEIIALLHAIKETAHACPYTISVKTVVAYHNQRSVMDLKTALMEVMNTTTFVQYIN